MTIVCFPTVCMWPACVQLPQKQEEGIISPVVDFALPLHPAAILAGIPDLSACHNLLHIEWSAQTKVKSSVLPDLQFPDLSRLPT